MKYEFKIMEVNDNHYTVDVCIKDIIDNTFFRDTLEARYENNMVLLDLNYIRSVILDKTIRLEFVARLKMFIKEYIMKHK